MNIYRLFRSSVTQRRWDRVDSYVVIAANPEDAKFSHSLRLQAFAHIKNREYDEEVHTDLELEVGSRCMPVTEQEQKDYNLIPNEWHVTLLGQAAPEFTEDRLICLEYYPG